MGKHEESFGCLVALLLMILGLAYLWIGIVGIKHQFGGLAVIIAIFFLTLFRFTLPLSIGTYFGIVDVIGWPWWVGLLIAAPSLTFIIPDIIYGTITTITNRFR